MSNWNVSVAVVCPYCDRTLEVIVYEPDSYTRTQDKVCVWCKKLMEIEYSAAVTATASRKEVEDEGT